MTTTTKSAIRATVHTPEQLQGMTPVEIDTALVELLVELAKAKHYIASYAKSLAEWGEGGHPQYAGFLASQQEYEVKRATLEDAIANYDGEWQERGCWQRYTLVNGGHIHYRQCHTLRWDTWTAFFPEASGMTPEELVATFSYTACTHCFPEAPVARKLTPAEEGYCARSGEYMTEAQQEVLARRWGPGGWVRAAVAPSVRCECGASPSITKTGKLRKHKPGTPK